MSATVDSAGAFRFEDVPEGWCLVSAYVAGLGEPVKAIRVDSDVDVGEFLPPPPLIHQDFVLVCTVCDLLLRPYVGAGTTAVIVGVFKSGMDETLRLDCPTELVSGDVGWPSSIGLTNVAPPPENLRDQIEAKRQEILKGAPPNAPLRPERVVGLYGSVVRLAGLTAAKCCSAKIETSLPPARLFGFGETDLRVIR